MKKLFALSALLLGLQATQGFAEELEYKIAAVGCFTGYPTCYVKTEPSFVSNAKCKDTFAYINLGDVGAKETYAGLLALYLTGKSVYLESKDCMTLDGKPNGTLPSIYYFRSR